MICSTAYAEQLHNHIQRIIHRMKHELHKSENDHSHTFIPSTFQEAGWHLVLEPRWIDIPLFTCHWDKQYRWPCGDETMGCAMHAYTPQRGRICTTHTRVCIHTWKRNQTQQLPQSPKPSLIQTHCPSFTPCYWPILYRDFAILASIFFKHQCYCKLIYHRQNSGHWSMGGIYSVTQNVHYLGLGQFAYIKNDKRSQN